jgi:hypothetical protein
MIAETLRVFLFPQVSRYPARLGFDTGNHVVEDILEISRQTQ